MRVFVGLAVLILLVSISPAAEEKARGPYDRVAPGKPPAKDTKVYTNADLEKLFGIVEEADREAPALDATPPDAVPPDAEPPATTEVDTKKPETEAPDPLAWLQQRQAAQRDHAAAVREAEAAVVVARERVTDLERLLLATRNPFSARPNLSDEEKEKRRAGGESAADRHERTKGMLEEAREAVSAAEAELARVRAGRP